MDDTFKPGDLAVVTAGTIGNNTGLAEEGEYHYIKNGVLVRVLQKNRSLPHAWDVCPVTNTPDAWASSEPQDSNYVYEQHLLLQRLPETLDGIDVEEFLNG